MEAAGADCREGRDIRVAEHLGCALVIERASPGESSELKCALRSLNGRNEKKKKKGWF